MSHKYDGYSRIPSVRIKKMLKLHNDKKFQNKALKYIASTICLMLHEIIELSIRAALKENTYIVNVRHLFDETLSEEFSIRFLFINLPFFQSMYAINKIETQKVNFFMGYIEKIRTDVLKTLGITRKKIKLKKIFKESLIIILLQHITYLSKLIESCYPFLEIKIIKIESIQMIYNMWMTFNEVSQIEMISFHHVIKIKMNKQ